MVKLVIIYYLGLFGRFGLWKGRFWYIVVKIDFMVGKRELRVLGWFGCFGCIGEFKERKWEVLSFKFLV